MKSMKLGLLAACCMALVACKETYSGSLAVSKDLVFKAKKGVVTLPAGNYNAKVAIGDKTLDIETKNKDKALQQKASFMIPKGQKIRSFNDIDLISQANGQDYSLKGAERTEHSSSGETSAVESCTYYTSERQCGYEAGPSVCHTQTTCDANNQCTSTKTCSPGPQQYVCRDVQVSHTGRQDVRYYYSYSDTARQIQIIEESTGAVVALFRNSDHDSNKHYTYEGRCW